MTGHGQGRNDERLFSSDQGQPVLALRLTINLLINIQSCLRRPAGYGFLRSCGEFWLPGPAFLSLTNERPFTVEISVAQVVFFAFSAHPTRRAIEGNAARRDEIVEGTRKIE